MAPNKYIQKIFNLEEVKELSKEEKEQRIKEIEESSSPKARYGLQYFGTPMTGALIDILEENPTELTTAKGLAKYGFDETFFEAVGGVGGMYAFLQQMAKNPGMITKIGSKVPFYPKTPVGLFGLFMADVLGMTTGSVISKLEQGEFEERTKNVDSFWEQAAIGVEILGEEFNDNKWWAAIGPVMQGVFTPFRKYLAGVTKKGGEFYDKAAKYVGDRLSFAMAEVGEGPLAKIVKRATETLGQIPILGTSFTKTSKERVIALNELFSDFINKLGPRVDYRVLSENIFDASKGAIKNFKDTVGKFKQNVFNAEAKAIEAAGPRFSKTIPTNRFTDFLVDYTTNLEKAFGGGKPLGPGMYGYNDFYAFAKSFFLPQYKNSRITFETFQDTILPVLKEATKTAKNQVGFNAKTLNDAFFNYNKLIDDIVDPQKIKGFDELAPEAQTLLKEYSQSIKDYKNGYATLKKPFERVLAGEFKKVDKLIFSSGRDISQEEMKRYVDDIVAPLLKKMTPGAVEDLIVLTGGNKELVGSLLRAYIDQGIKASTETVASRGLLGREAEAAVFNPKKFMEYFGLNKESLNSQKETFKKIFNFLDDVPENSPWVTGKTGIDYEVFDDILSLMAKQAELKLPNVNKYLTRNYAIGGKGVFGVLKKIPQIGLITAAIGPFPSIVASVLGIKGLQRALTNPEFIKRAVKGLDVTAPLAARDNSIAKALRVLYDDRRQNLEDKALNTELGRLKGYADEIDEDKKDLSILEKVINDEGLLGDTVNQIREAIDSVYINEDTGVSVSGEQNVPYSGNKYIDKIKTGTSISEETEKAADIMESVVQEAKTPTIPIPEVTRGQGNVLPEFNMDISPKVQSEIMQSIDPNVLKNLEDVGLPLFEKFNEGGIVGLYESKKFKKPQVVA